MSQMPIGKYIYCTGTRYWVTPDGLVVTNAYRQVHLLYREKQIIIVGTNLVTNAYRQVHLLYLGLAPQEGGDSPRHKCLSASTFTVPGAYLYGATLERGHKCLSASTFTVPPFSVY